MRFVLKAALVVLLTVGLYVLVQTHYKVDFKKALKDKALYGHAFRNLTMKTIVECFFACLKDCLCVTFQMCVNTGCQLLSSNQFEAPSALRTLEGCSYYDMLPMAFQQDNSIKFPNCRPGWDCCKDSYPCLNGGTCESASFSPTNYTTHRFRCKCLHGYTGKRCQHYAPKSCRSYINDGRATGKFMVFDENMKPFEVFCDFDLHSTMAWTLVQSYQLQNKDQFLKSFLVDDPINQDSPVWDSYRLSKSRMESIQQGSSKWRMTCQYDSDGVVYTDYVQAANDKINVLTYDDIACKEVEYIDIRGQNCTNCTTWVAQTSTTSESSGYPLQIDSWYTTEKKCTFQPRESLPCSDNSGEDNFGFYHCQNPAHRCSRNLTSTTQTWFGGY